MSSNKLLSLKSPLWRDENLYFRIPSGYRQQKRTHLRNHPGTGRRRTSGFEEKSFAIADFTDRRNDGDGFEILANVLNHIRSQEKFANSEEEHDNVATGKNMTAILEIINLIANLNVLETRFDFDDAISYHYEEPEEEIFYEEPEISYYQEPEVTQRRRRRKQQKPIKYIIDPLKDREREEFEAIIKSFYANVTNSKIDEKETSLLFNLVKSMKSGRYAFLLGIVPATLTTLAVLGHPPLQVSQIIKG